MRVSMLTFVLLICGVASAAAQTTIDADRQKAAQAREHEQKPDGRPSTQVQANPPARFSFNPVESGFLRLDNDSGEVAYCSAQPAGWTCQPISIQRADTEGAKNGVAVMKGLKAEIARLQEEIASLKKQVAELKEPSPPRPPADLTPNDDKGSDVTIRLPSPEEVARAREFVEATWRRLVEMLVTIQKDIMRKS